MAIKCSLLGHKFGESTVERDREEQGSEVIITIKETEVCERCGEERVVSENKEVTSLEMPDDVEPAEEGERADGPDAGDESPTEPGTDDDAEVFGDEAPADDGPTPDQSARDHPETEASGADQPAEPVAEAESDPETDPIEDEEPPVTDDAEILDDEEPERDPGEWPQESEPETSRDEEDFDQYGYMDDEEGSTVDEDATDAEIIDEGPEDATEESGGEEGPDVETNAWPSEDEEVVENEAAGPGAVTVPDGEFVCEACGFSTPVEESSLRAGDFCPECHKETLVQVRER